MDGYEDGPLNDQALDREIVAALAIDPSPELRARVRARVAEERMRSAWSRPVVVGWAAATTAIVVIFVMALAVPETERAVSVPRGTPTVPRHTPAQEPDVVARTRATTPIVRPETLARVVHQAAARPSTPISHDVMVSPEDATALRGLVAALATRQVEADDIPPLGVEAEPLPPIEAIALEPIKLSPIDGLESE